MHRITIMIENNCIYRQNLQVHTVSIVKKQYQTAVHTIQYVHTQEQANVIHSNNYKLNHDIQSHAETKSREDLLAALQYRCMVWYGMLAGPVNEGPWLHRAHAVHVLRNNSNSASTIGAIRM